MQEANALEMLVQTLLPNQPALRLWLAGTLACAIILVYTQYRRARQAGDTPASSLQTLAAALAKGLAFTGLALLVFLLLTRGYDGFNRVYANFLSGGSLSNQAWERWHALYGEHLVQRELEVTHYVKETRVTQVWPGDADHPAAYVDEEVEMPLALNSITAFNGSATLNLVDPQHQEDAYNAFALTARYVYEVTNPSDKPTRAAFRFPFDTDSRLYRDIHVLRSGEEFEDWAVNYNVLNWSLPMQPGQVEQIEIRYTTWGMNGYTYMLETPRRVSSFELSLAFESEFH